MVQTALLALYAPYCGGLSREGDLKEALIILQSQSFEGERAVKGGSGHAYQLSWSGGTAPLEPSVCRLTFPMHPSLVYSFELVTHQLVDWLMQRDRSTGQKDDLPDAFWHWLLAGVDEEGAAPRFTGEEVVSAAHGNGSVDRIL